MPEPRCRPFTVLDGMILVGATGFGIWFGKIAWPSFEQEWVDLGHSLLHPGFDDVHAGLTGVAYAVLPVVLPWTFAALLLALRRPRPSLRRLCRQPGFAACLAVIVAFSINTLGELGAEARNPRPDYLRRLELELINLPGEVYGSPLGLAVVSVWVVMGLGRMFRRGPGWVERTALVLGVYWVVEMILSVSRRDAD